MTGDGLIMLSSLRDAKKLKRLTSPMNYSVLHAFSTLLISLPLIIQSEKLFNYHFTYSNGNTLRYPDQSTFFSLTIFRNPILKVKTKLFNQTFLMFANSSICKNTNCLLFNGFLNIEISKTSLIFENS